MLFLATFYNNSDYFQLSGAPGGVKLCSRRSEDVRGRPEVQNGCLRALEDAWMTNSRLRDFLSSLVFFGASLNACRAV